MAINPESLTKLTELQERIWEAATGPATMAFSAPVKFENPLVVAASAQDVASDIPGPMLAIQFAFTSAPSNEQLLLMPPEMGLQLVKQLNGEEIIDLNEEILEACKPAFQGLAEGICEGCSSVKDTPETLGSCTLQRQIVELPLQMQEVADLVRVQVAMTIGEVSGTLMWLFDKSTARALLNASAFQAVEAVEDAGLESQIPAALRTNPELDVILDIPLQISVELGRMSMLVQDVVELGTGSIIEIDKAAGDPVDVLVNGMPVARGEVVVIDDNFGVRITEILSPKERISKLGDAA